MESNMIINDSYAAIDIGTNAVRLLIKHVDDDGKSNPKFTKELLVRVPMRLGFDVFADGCISDKKARKMVRLMKAYRQLMKIYDVADYRACATSAIRDASNGGELVKKIEKETGIAIEIISGQEEARMVYNNHIEQLEDRDGNYMYVDVGGGSTEINMLSKGELVYSHSYNIGTIRMLNDAVDSEEWDMLGKDVEELAGKYPGTNIIGSGGNINKYLKLIDSNSNMSGKNRISVVALKIVYDTLRNMTVEERMEKFKLKTDRADVIVPAGKIFTTIADLLKASYILVPVIGLADGIIDGIYAKNKKMQ